MSAWKQLAVLLGTYIIGVFVVGPLLMRNRKPFQLINVIRAYNIVQITFCSYSLFVFYSTGYTFAESFRCSRMMSDENFQKILAVWWIAVNVRLLELIETVFFVLRKKQNQVSILHVYHHIGSIFGVWFSLKYDASEFIEMQVWSWILITPTFRSRLDFSWRFELLHTCHNVLLLPSQLVRQIQDSSRCAQANNYCYADRSAVVHVHPFLVRSHFAVRIVLLHSGSRKLRNFTFLVRRLLRQSLQKKARLMTM